MTALDYSDNELSKLRSCNTVRKYCHAAAWDYFEGILLLPSDGGAALPGVYETQPPRCLPPDRR